MAKHRARSMWVAGAGLIGLAAAVLPACLPTATFLVDSTTDAVDADPGDGDCATAAGECTLRAAVQEANTRTEVTQIDLQPDTTYTLSLTNTTPTTLEDANLTGDLDITAQVNILGHGATIDADDLDRVLDVRPGGALYLDDATLTNGTATHGGGIRITDGATARVHHTTVTANTATGHQQCTVNGSGGGFPPPGWEPSCTDDETAPSSLYTPAAPASVGGGGGVWNAGELDLWASAVTDNTLTRGSRCFDAGLRGVSYICDISTGAGVYNQGRATLSATTISGNHGSVGAAIGTHGLALFHGTAFGELDPETTGAHVTVADNDTSEVDTLAELPILNYGFFVGNLRNMTATAIQLHQIDVYSSAIGTSQGCSSGAGATPGTFVGPIAVTASHTVAADATCTEAGTDGNVVADPLLGPLAPNGGPTRTHLPGEGSPAIDVVPVGQNACGVNPYDDQRGVGRPQGPACDAGAVEVAPPPAD